MVKPALLVLLAAAGLSAAPQAALEILAAKCAGCHGPSVALSNLRLDSRDALTRGGKRGPAFNAANPAQSLLLTAVRHDDPKLAMPPGGKLSADEIKTLESWLAEGASWGDTKNTAANTNKWWAFQKPQRVQLPSINPPANGNDVDRFLAAALRAKGLAPAPRAAKRTLIRRATYDLHGLAPNAAEIAAFENDNALDAYARLIDRLLASPRYGEKWGKHWLDLARYGDTSGFEQDPYNLYAWRYRDYLIKAFNDDKPYDRFLKETIAGDELYEDPESQQGTGFYLVGPNRDMLYKVEDINRVESLTDFVDTTGAVFLGLTVGCARCHDHKYDPIPQKDYYRLQAVFAPFQKSRVFLHYNNARGYDLSENTRTFKLYDIGAELMSIKSPYQERLKSERLAKLSPEIQAAFKAEENDRTPEQKALFEMYSKQVNPSDSQVLALLSPADKERLRRVEQRLVGLYNTYQPGPFSPGLTDVGRESPKTLFPGTNEEIKPGFPSVLGGGDIPEPPLASLTTQRRRALAEWIASPENPLTARVWVNRVWQYHFGQGLVATPSDFGTRSSPPSHPELLDWLATNFMKNGWSTKKLHRTLMLSAAYQQASNPSPAALEKDPGNVWLSHFTRRRLDAEEIRDSVLQSAGTLNEKMGGRPVVPELAAEELYGMSQPIPNAWVVTSDKSEHTRRSIYMISRRNFRMPMLEAFDRPEGVLSCSRRESSTTAPQSLSLLNSAFTVAQATALAAKAATPEAVFERVFARPATQDERTMANAFVEKQTQLAGSRDAALTELARALLNTNEFLYVD